MSLTELAREDTLSTKGGRGSFLPSYARPQPQREVSTGTDCAVTGLAELDHISESNRSRDMTSGWAHVLHHPLKNNGGGPSRRHSLSHSISSHSSAGSGLMTRRNSFSSLFTAQTDPDSLEGPPLKEDCGDILQEGQEHLSMAMLVNVYAQLRELSMLGLASVKLVDIDVTSHQSISRKKEMKRRLGVLEEDDDSYLAHTKTAGAIVR